MLPAKFGLDTKPGASPLFEDPRITWAMDTLGIPEGQRILELGPLEAGHSYMLQRAGARDIISIEANTRAFMKCLCVKELLDLHRVHFLLGDFVSYLKQDTSRYDAVMASGVLYQCTTGGAAGPDLQGHQQGHALDALLRSRDSRREQAARAQVRAAAYVRLCRRDLRGVDAVL